MALFKPYKITSDKLEDLAIKEGQLIVTTDTKKLYVDVSGTERIEVTSDAEIDLSDYVTTSILTSTVGEEASERQKQDQLLEQAIDDKVGADDIIAGSNIQVNHDDVSGHITISATDTNTNTTYTLSKSGSTITLSGSDGSSTSVTDANTTYSLGSFGITASAAELNKLDGVTATATELNYVDGVTSNIQTQLNGKASATHNHSASNITSGYLPISRGGLGGGTATASLFNLISDSVQEFKGADISNIYVALVDGDGSATDPIIKAITPANFATGVATLIKPSDIGAATSSHTHNNATTTAAGFLPKLGGGTANFLRADGTWAKPPDTNTTYSAMTGATTSAAGKTGLVPAPAAGAATRYLRSDGTWQVPPDTNTTYSAATTSSAGLMSAADKTKLDGIAAGANKYTLPVATASALGGVRIGFPESGKNYPVELNSSNQMFVNVPWTDTNTTYTLSSFGITATAAELNKLDGVTATATELNYVEGVTSNIQTQLNGKAASSHTHSYLPLSGGTLTGTLNSRAIAPTATNTYSLGTSSLKYNAVYATTFYGSLSGNASSATKLGSSTVGSSVKPIYLDKGAAIASSSTVGSATRPVYLNNGAITQGTYTLGAACEKGVDTSISTGSTSTNLPTSEAVAALVASSGGGQEIAIQSTEPTDSNIKLWIKI